MDREPQPDSRPADHLRPEVASLPRYVPGERPADGARVAKLSSNEMPHPPLPGVPEAAHAALLDSGRYPDMAATELVTAIAGRFGLTSDHVAVGNGSTAVLETILRATCAPGDEVVVPWRSFEAYPIAVQLTGADMVRVPLTPDGRHDLPAMAAAITDRTAVVLLCSPNNPTSTALSHGELRDFLARVPRTVLVLLDEAYIDFVTAPDPTDGPALLAEHPRLVVLRTFSKAASLAGLRVGYALAHPDLVAGIRAASTPFGVSAAAQAAATAALFQQSEIRRRVAEVVAERDRLVAGLRAHLDVPDAQGNFVWLPLGERAVPFADAARAEGLLLRPFPGEGVRISVGTAEDTDRVLDLARRLLAD